jgi:glycosyltransferase involved in cell wall biosynthesis
MRKVHFFATYFEQKEKAHTLINALLAQTADNWELTICSNGDETVNELDITDKRINVKLTKENTGFWGALNRKEFIHSNALGNDDLLINTSVEDYYIPKLVEYINEFTQDFIYWDVAHHQFGYNTNFAIGQPRIKKMDWGGYAVKGSIAKSTQMGTVEIPQADGTVKSTDYWKEFMGDGYFVEHIFAQNPAMKTIRIPKILFIKN